MTLDSLSDLDTSGLCLVKTLSRALTCWPFQNTALRDGARTSTRTSSVAKDKTSWTKCDRSMRWADVYVCMLADGVALRNRCPQGHPGGAALDAGPAAVRVFLWSEAV